MAQTDERKNEILRSNLQTIFLEAKEPIIRAVAESALMQTGGMYEPKKSEKIKTPSTHNNHCKKHNWFGLPEESCPEC